MRLPVIAITGEALSRFDEAIQKEWLVTNGLGGYAGSTVLGINTRKYHGLLVAALNPPGDRTVCLEKLDEEVHVGSANYPLGANEFPGGIHPQGYFSLKDFSVAPFPTYVYAVQDVEVKKTIFMPKEKNATVVMYKVRNNNDVEVKLRVFPLLSCRYFHSVLDRQKTSLVFSQQHKGGEIELKFETPRVTICSRATNGEFIEKTAWIDHLFYREEAQRGESSINDCFQPGYFELAVPPKREDEFDIVTAADESSEKAGETLNAIGNSTHDVNKLFTDELQQRSDELARFYGSHKKAPASDWLSWMLLAADAFVVKGAGDRKNVIAGYFWFEPWGRDTFISLPGLMLVTGKFEDARKIFVGFLRRRKHGLIPNFLQDASGESAYNTVDAALWYANAVLQYVKYTGDFEFVQEHLWEGLKEIVDSHVKGTDFGIHVDGDGLLAHGPRLTWMDAEVDGVGVTPREGKAVEIQALWYNALMTMRLLAIRLREKSLSEEYGALASEAKESFNLKFWNNQKGCLFDVVADSGVDASVRPNQVIAAALDFQMLDNAKRERIVDMVQRELLTPCGLQTLSRSDSRYRGMYVGDRRVRDQAYHNGTVWAWLLGPFASAFARVKGQGIYESEGTLRNLLVTFFIQQNLQGGLGTVNEIFDGDAPHTPRGCIAQAWSVAEPLRAYLEDVLQFRAKFEKDALQA